MSFRNDRVSLFGIAALVVFAGAASFSAVCAEDFATDVPDRVWIDLGGGANTVGTNVSFIGAKGVGAAVNFEDVFDLPGNKTTFRILGTVRISEKRRYIDFGYVNIDRSGSTVLDQEIKIGDYTIQGGGTVGARFATQFIYSAFRYDFLHEEKVRISGSAGLTFIRLTTSFNGNGSYYLPEDNPDLPPPNSGDFGKEGSAGAPVPMVGLNLDWALTKRLVVRSYNRFFRLNLSSFNGGLYESGVRLNWYFVKNFGLGLGLDRTDLKIKELKVGDGNVLKADYSITGIGLYANLAF